MKLKYLLIFAVVIFIASCAIKRQSTNVEQVTQISAKKNEGRLLDTTIKASPSEDKKTKALVMPDSSRYTRIVLAEGLDEPMEMAILPNLDILFIERKGGV